VQSYLLRRQVKRRLSSEIPCFAKYASAEAAAAEAAAAVEAVAAAEAAAAMESAAAAGGAAKAAADAPGAEAALAPELLPKKRGGGADGMAEDAEEISGRPMLSVGAREELKTRGGPLSSEGENAAAQAERSTPIKFFRSLQYSTALILNAITTLNKSSEFIFMVISISA
jgi:hypothetical protein